RTFLGLIVYFKSFVEGYMIISLLLTRLLRKNTLFVFGEPEKAVIHILKDALASKPVLIRLDYTSGNEVILIINASGLS
ncbi:hypothetical protein BKA67DRAFT_516739, partial [Truncatella angustata]